MPAKPVRFIAALAVLSGVLLWGAPAADAFSGFKARYSNTCPATSYTLCGVTHEIGSNTDDTPATIGEGASREVSITCNRPQWERDGVATGYCGRWRAPAWSSQACNKPAPTPGDTQKFEQHRTVECFQPDNGTETDSPEVSEVNPGTHAHVIERCEPDGASGTKCEYVQNTGSCPSGRPATRRVCMEVAWESSYSFGQCYWDGANWVKQGIRRCLDTDTGQAVADWRCTNYLPGDTTTIQSCQVGWSDWSSFDTCDAQASKTRTRECTLLGSGRVIDDRYCAGSSSQTRRCATSWTSWSNWSSCNRQARTQRTRDCKIDRTGRTVSDRYCGGSGRQTTSCNTRWGNWTNWGSCSARATKSRTGTCYAYPGQTRVSDRYCSGSNTQTTSCNTRWGSWSGWGACRGNTQTRTRDCYAEGRRVANRFCSGSSRDTRSCFRGCSATGVQWGTWGSCSSSIGSASHGTIRRVEDPWNAFGRNMDYYGDATFVCQDGRWQLQGSAGRCYRWVD